MIVDREVYQIQNKSKNIDGDHCWIFENQSMLQHEYGPKNKNSEISTNTDKKEIQSSGKHQV